MHALTQAAAQARRILLTAPSDLDADAIGAIEALRRAIGVRWPQAEVRVLLDDPVPADCAFLCGAAVYGLAAEHAPGPVDLAIVVDGDPRRLQATADHLAQAGCVAMIDHHQSSHDAPVDIAIFDPRAASTTVLVLPVLDAWGVPLDRAIATALYGGLVFDTSAFRYQSTTPAVMRAAARMMETGLDHTDLIERILLVTGPDKARLRGHVLANLQYAADGAIAWAALCAETIGGASTGGLINDLVFIDGVEVAIVCTEREGAIKLSLRSRRRVDVATLARSLSKRGGGHARAAGATVVGGQLAEVAARAVAAATAALDD